MPLHSVHREGSASKNTNAAASRKWDGGGQRAPPDPGRRPGPRRRPAGSYRRNVSTTAQGALGFEIEAPLWTHSSRRYSVGTWIHAAAAAAAMTQSKASALRIPGSSVGDRVSKAQ